MTGFDNVPVHDGQNYNGQLQPQPPSAPSAGASAEQTREMAEVQGAMLIARANPRNEEESYQKILNACKRKSLAETALYEYKRGGNTISGASVRLAETCARLWGNVTYGFRELAREGKQSEVLAFAWDLETNTRVARQFTVRHRRDKQSGPEDLTQERDIYEMMASFAQRRVRACLLELIPGDIVEEAVEQCQKTIKSNAAKGDQAEKITKAFEPYGVTREMLNEFLGYDIGNVTADDVTKLKGIYQALQDGEGVAEEYFNFKGGKKSGKGKKKRNQSNEQPQEPNAEGSTGEGTDQSAEGSTEGAQAESSVIECPNQDNRPISKQYCNETCQSREGCPAWE